MGCWEETSTQFLSAGKIGQLQDNTARFLNASHGCGMGSQEETLIQFQVASQNVQLRDNTLQFLKTMDSSWGRTLVETIVQFWVPREVGVSMHCAVLQEEKNIEGCIRKVCNSRKLYEARLLEKASKCEISEIDVKIDRT